MSHARVSLSLALGMMACLVGCNRNEVPTTPAANAPSEATAPTRVQSMQPERLTAGLMAVEPAELTACEPTIVALRWDVSGVTPDLPLVEIWTGPATNESIFASGGTSGEAATGAWAMPGTTFTLKDMASGKVVSRIAIGGPPCS